MANLEQLRDTLIARGFGCSVFDTAPQAVAYLKDSLKGRTIGFGGSVTVREMGLYEALAQENTCYWHWEQGTRDQAAGAQVYISSLNGVAETGELVNIDGSGNRVASGLYGHEKVVFVVGVNKIAPDLEGAIWRARNVAGPKNAQRLGKKTPCAAGGDRCYDCNSPERICSAMVLYWRCPTAIPEMELVIINQELGY